MKRYAKELSIARHRSHGLWGAALKLYLLAGRCEYTARALFNREYAAFRDTGAGDTSLAPGGIVRRTVYRYLRVFGRLNRRTAL